MRSRLCAFSKDSCGEGHHTLAGTRLLPTYALLCVYSHRQTGPAALRVVSTVRLLHLTDVIPCPSLHLFFGGCARIVITLSGIVSAAIDRQRTAGITFLKFDYLREP
jgi:hypothetical protein